MWWARTIYPFFFLQTFFSSIFMSPKVLYLLDTIDLIPTLSTLIFFRFLDIHILQTIQHVTVSLEKSTALLGPTFSSAVPTRVVGITSPFSLIFHISYHIDLLYLDFPPPPKTFLVPLITLTGPGTPSILHPVTH